MVNQIIKVYGVLLIVPIVLLLCFFSIRGYVASTEETRQLTEEIVDLRTQVQVFESNKQRVQSDLDSYNNLLLSIIPNQEDYFSIILALEKISQQTGFIIDKYTILLASTTSEKLAMSVEGTGDSAAFLRFLQEYQYGGGRLITNEKMEYSTATAGQTKLSLNFYNKALTTEDLKIEPIEQRDINVIREIQQKVNVEFLDTVEEINPEYETKSNPF